MTVTKKGTNCDSHKKRGTNCDSYKRGNNCDRVTKRGEKNCDSLQKGATTVTVKLQRGETVTVAVVDAGEILRVESGAAPALHGVLDEFPFHCLNAVEKLPAVVRVLVNPLSQGRAIRGGEVNHSRLGCRFWKQRDETLRYLYNI